MPHAEGSQRRRSCPAERPGPPRSPTGQLYESAPEGKQKTVAALRVKMGFGRVIRRIARMACVLHEHHRAMEVNTARTGHMYDTGVLHQSMADTTHYSVAPGPTTRDWLRDSISRRPTSLIWLRPTPRKGPPFRGPVARAGRRRRERLKLGITDNQRWAPSRGRGS